MTNEVLNAKHVVNVLNRALSKDPRAIESLIEHRERCNEELADDETIQVMLERCLDGTTWYEVGALGLINGILGAHPDTKWGRVAACFDDETGRLLRFDVLDPVTKKVVPEE